MLNHLVARASRDTVPLRIIAKDDLAAWLKTQPAANQAWVAGQGFTAKAGSHLAVPDGKGGVTRVLVGQSASRQPWDYARLATALPAGRYALEGRPAASLASQVALGWALGCYAFTRYKADSKPKASLVWPAQADKPGVSATVEAIGLVRDLINTPANDMGPADLAVAARTLARRHKARISVTTGQQLLARNYPTIHMVGRAAGRGAEPRLIDLSWGRAAHPRVTLVGKGVCFDTGGLDLKPAAGMLEMKKDMGGAAHVLGLAHMIMAAKLPVRLRVLVPAVENSVSGNAMRPRDIVKTRKGLTVEIGNTDAEGRLVLCDALAEAVREKPAMIVDYATLTGAARVALGTDLPALFCNDDRLAEDILQAGQALEDPLWRMPLHQPYRELIRSPIADLNNVSDGPFAGAITAALFLEHFVDEATPWAHIDLMAGNRADRPGRPRGGEAQALRAVYQAIARRFPADGKKARR
ncbi:MAG: leucyl aminopeptidase family protein [Alphaproteobacteria bacterium]